MARSEDNKKEKPRPMDLVVSGLSVVSAIAVFNFSWGFRNDVEEMVKSHANILKPTREETQSVCSELLEKHEAKSHQEHQEFREGITWLMRNMSYKKGFK